MSSVTFRKACACQPHTATSGRVIVSTPRLTDDCANFKVQLRPEPVCDVCDTPWSIERLKEERT
jgi:hypothetical protein